MAYITLVALKNAAPTIYFGLHGNKSGRLQHNFKIVVICFDFWSGYIKHAFVPGN